MVHVIKLDFTTDRDRQATFHFAGFREFIRVIEILLFGVRILITVNCVLYHDRVLSNTPCIIANISAQHCVSAC